MDEIIAEFKTEAQDLVKHLGSILDEAEDDFTKVRSLDTFGQMVDRIMGSAKTIASQDPSMVTMEAIAKYSELSKAIGYKGSQITDNEELYHVTVGILLDSTEMLDELVDSLGESEDKGPDSFFSKHFLDRLTWLAEQFDDSYRASLKIETQKSGSLSSQAEIDALIAHFSK